MRSLHLISIFIFYPIAFVSAQEIEYTFNASQNENEVYLNWVIAQGNSCDGTDIERAFDTSQFEKIGSISGICGSADFSQNYSFTDIRPIPNSINYYRLVFGGRQYSSLASVYFVAYNNFGYSVNNAAENTTIYFLTNTFQKLRFILADMNGRILSEVDEIMDGKVQIDNNGLHHGFYVFMITDARGYKLQRGKIFID
jgi:hypothetical protein